MTKSEKVTDILQILDKLYPNPPIPLDHKDAYTLLIAVLLSAQCTDVRVNKTTPSLFKLADNPFDMMKLSVDEIREIIKPCGLSPMKSKGIAGLSKILVEQYNGEVPNTFEALESLPAVGHKTASVVMTQWFGVPAFPVDTHIHRVGQRIGFLPANISADKAHPVMESIVPPEAHYEFHLNLIRLGREICQARRPKCELCPLTAHCDYYKSMTYGES